MIPVILKSGTGFNGIDYNSQKVKEGVAEFIHSENIPLNNPNSEDIKNVFEQVCAVNSTVKIKQFHASVSCQGREYTKDQLKDIGLQYIEKMGYSNCPFAMYFHKDTENNHIHIVSTRVDLEGNKVNDSFEKKRSLKVIAEIMQQDYKEVAKKDLSEAMQYNFSTSAQFKMILEGKGWSVNDRKPIVDMYRGGIKEFSFSKQEIDNKINLYIPNEERKKQIGAILNKYSKGLEPLQLAKYMKNTHGIELVFHKNKSHDKPYGYTIIDMANKNVFKGSEVYSLNKILANKNIQDKINSTEIILNELLNKKNQSYKALKGELKFYGLELKGKNIYVGSIKQSLFKLPEDIYKELRYEDRKNEANSFNISSKGEALAMAKIFYVHPNDLLINPMADKKEYLNDEITSIVGNQREVNNSNWAFFDVNNRTYLIDKQKKQINDVTYFKDYIGKEATVNSGNDLGRVRDQVNDIGTSQSFLNTLLDTLNQNFGGGEQDTPRKKRRRTSN